MLFAKQNITCEVAYICLVSNRLRLNNDSAGSHIKEEGKLNSGAPSRAKRAWDRAPYSLNMVNLFSFGCDVTDRAYVRTRLQIVRVG